MRGIPILPTILIRCPLVLLFDRSLTRQQLEQ